MTIASSSTGRWRVIVTLMCCAAGGSSGGCDRKGAHGADAGSADVGATTGAAGTTGTGGGAEATGGTAGATEDAGATGGAAGATGGAAGATGGAAGATGGAAGAIVPPYKSYELTGSFPNQRIAIEQKPGMLAYAKVVIHDQFLAESCAIGDYDNDGIPDVSSGRIWYQGPDFKMTHPFREGHGPLPRTGAAAELDTGESDDQADYPLDVDGDGWTDIINVAAVEVDEVTFTNPKIGTVQRHSTAYWYENPGPALAGDPMWTPHLMHSDVRGEHHGLFDVDGDGFPEIFGACKGCTPPRTQGYYQSDRTNPLAQWTYHAVTDAVTFPYAGGKLHGEGAGDVNGDGRPDLLERRGVWLQQPDGTSSSTVCTGRNIPAGCGFIKEKTPLLPTGFYDGLPDNAGNKGASHMYAVDMDKDGCADVVAADWAHGVGLYWYRQQKLGGTCSLAFEKFQFMGDAAASLTYTPSANTAGDAAKWGAGFTQPHALQVVDMDGDGRADVVTGKTRFAHPKAYGNPDADGTPYLYVFKNVAKTDPRTGAPITLEPVLVDGDPTKAPGTPEGGMGIGRQFAVGHVNTDGILDLCVATRVGLAVFLGK